MTTAKTTERNRCLDQLRKWLKPKMTVYTCLRHVSSSGMSRDISVHIVCDSGEILNVSAAAAGLLGWTLKERNGSWCVRVSGCGMDMGFHLVYSLGRVVWPDGTPEPHGTRNGEPDTCGGYALNHRWL